MRGNSITIYLGEKASLCSVFLFNGGNRIASVRKVKYRRLMDTLSSTVRASSSASGRCKVGIHGFLFRALGRL